MKIHPAPLSPDKDDLYRQLKDAETYVDEVDIDIVDWKWTPNKTVDMNTVLGFDVNIKYNFDLMVDKPSEYLEKLVKDPRVISIIFNLRAKEDFQKIIFQLYDANINKKLGIALNPENTAQEIQEFLEILEIVEIYTIEPGAQGQPFLPERLELSNDLMNMGFEGEIFVDGGVNETTIPTIIKYPVDVLCVGSYLSKSPDPKASYERLKTLVNEDNVSRNL